MRRCYTVSGGSVIPGIRVGQEVPYRVAVGEAGRGRKLVLVPVPPGAEIKDGVVLSLPGREGEAVVVLVRDHSGYRGTWRLRAATPPEKILALVRARKEHQELSSRSRETGEDERTLLYQRGHDVWAPGGCPLCTHDAPPPPPGLLRVIAEGAKAQGDAGRMGGGPEYLLGLPSGVSFEIHRTGRLYGSPAVIRVEVGPDGDVRAVDPFAEAISASADM